MVVHWRLAFWHAIQFLPSLYRQPKALGWESSSMILWPENSTFHLKIFFILTQMPSIFSNQLCFSLLSLLIWEGRTVLSESEVQPGIPGLCDWQIHIDMLINACCHLCAKLFLVRMFCIPRALLFCKTLPNAINQLIQESSPVPETWNKLSGRVCSASVVYGGIIYC